MKTKHTPGPWQVHNPAVDTLAVHYGHFEFHSWPRNYSSQDLADAHLIAAAPELLEACRAISDAYGVQPCDSLERDAIRRAAWEKVRAAIRKAAG